MLSELWKSRSVPEVGGRATALTVGLLYYQLLQTLAGNTVREATIDDHGAHKGQASLMESMTMPCLFRIPT